MATLIPYSLNQTETILGSVIVDGWGETDAVSISPNADIVEYTISAGGSHVAVSSINDNSRLATLTMTYASRGYKQVMGLLLAQQQELRIGGAITPLPFSSEDTLNGTSIKEKGAIVLTMPTIEFGRKLGEQVVVLLLPDPEIKYAVDVAIS